MPNAHAVEIDGPVKQYGGTRALDGVSLTVNALPEPETVQLSLIEYTLRHTTLGELRVGDRVHVEGDVIGKYVSSLLSHHVVTSSRHHDASA